MLLSFKLSRLLLLAALTMSAAAHASNAASPAPAPLAPLLDAISERLTVADKVALTKWDSGKPIQDSPREAQVISGAQRLAPEYKLRGEDVSQFMAAQIESNKLVQYALLAKWHADGKAPDTARPDLVKQIRPQLDKLQTRLLQNYAAFAPYRQDPQCPNWLNQARQAKGVDAIHDMALLRAVGELCVSRK